MKSAKRLDVWDALWDNIASKVASTVFVSLAYTGGAFFIGAPTWTSFLPALPLSAWVLQ